MRDALGPYRAALSLGRRRSILLLFFLVTGIFGAIAWGTYVPLDDERGFLELLESNRPLTEDALFQHTQGFNCTGGFEVIPIPGKPGGEAAPIEQIPGGESTCRFYGRNGVPIGPAFPDPFINQPPGPFGPPQLPAEFLEQIRPLLIDEQRAVVESIKLTLSPTRVLKARLLTAGTFFGVLAAVVFASTFFGAEWRWGVWRTLLTHEPRRWLVLLAKFAAMWTLIAFGFVTIIGVASAVDAVMRSLSDVTATGGPGFLRLAKLAGRALLSPEVYATMAAGFAMALRTSIAGTVALGFILGDAALVSRFHWLRHWLPAQQIATLLPPSADVVGGYSWVPLQSAGFACDEVIDQGFSTCRQILLPPIATWRASVVLAGWVLGFALLAWLVLRSRDVPQ